MRSTDFVHWTLRSANVFLACLSVSDSVCEVIPQAIRDCVFVKSEKADTKKAGSPKAPGQPQHKRLHGSGERRRLSSGGVTDNLDAPNVSGDVDQRDDLTLDAASGI